MSVTFDDKGGNQNRYTSMVIITIQLSLTRILNVNKIAHISPGKRVAFEMPTYSIFYSATDSVVAINVTLLL